jgi:exosortase/archaeosortase family protein
MLPAFFTKKEEKMRTEAIAFLTRWGVLFVFFYFILMGYERALQEMETQHVQSILSALGMATLNGPTSIQFFAGINRIEISALCSGLIEMVLLGTAILATQTRSIHSRLRGVIVGVFLLYVFNLVRIVITILQLHYTTLSFATFTHDILFRLILILGFAILYGAWLNFDKICMVLRQKGFF